MPEDYRKVVFAAYLKKKREGSLSSNLLDPTPGNVREECLILYRERERNSKDDEILKQFFKGVDKEKGYLAALENSLAVKFKQMPNILKGKVPKHGIRYAELLAWLIDFQPRPSMSYFKSFDGQQQKGDVIGTTDVKIEETQNKTTGANDGGELKLENEGKNIIKESDKKEEVEKEPKETIEGLNTSEPIVETESNSEKERVDKPTVPPVIIIPVKINDGDKGADKTINVDLPKKPVYEPRFSSPQIIISCIILFFVCCTSFFVWERRTTSVRIPKADEKFMYWDGDHYEPIKEGAQKAGVTIIPLDLTLLQQQRKITLPDTLTKSSLGKVWYKGYGSKHEYFTFNGVYPADTARTLRPLSTTILTKYTSNYRYYLNRLIWFLCAAFLISIGGYVVSRMKRKIIVGKDVQTADDYISNLPEGQLA